MRYYSLFNLHIKYIVSGFSPYATVDIGYTSARTQSYAVASVWQKKKKTNHKRKNNRNRTHTHEHTHLISDVILWHLFLKYTIYRDYMVKHAFSFSVSTVHSRTYVFFCRFYSSGPNNRNALNRTSFNLAMCTYSGARKHSHAKFSCEFTRIFCSYFASIQIECECRKIHPNEYFFRWQSEKR